MLLCRDRPTFTLGTLLNNLMTGDFSRAFVQQVNTSLAESFLSILLDIMARGAEDMTKHVLNQ